MSDKLSYVTSFVRLSIMVALAALTASCSSTPTISKATQPTIATPQTIPKTLVIGLDGVSYFTFKKLQDGGYFRDFYDVAPMVATFPSISDPNWTHIMGLPPERNFTKSYFDPTIKTEKGFGAENGSLMDHMRRMPRYETVMDYKLEGAFQHLTTFVWTDSTALLWLEGLEKKFFEFKGRDTFFALIINTDLISHTSGEAPILKYLVELEK